MKGLLFTLAKDFVVKWKSKTTKKGNALKAVGGAMTVLGLGSVTQDYNLPNIPESWMVFAQYISTILGLFIALIGQLQGGKK